MLLPSHNPVKQPNARYRERAGKWVTNPPHGSVQKQVDGTERCSNKVFSQRSAIQVHAPPYWQHLNTLGLTRLQKLSSGGKLNKC